MSQSERAKEDKQDARSKARRQKLEQITQPRDPLPFGSFPWAEMLDAIRIVVEAGGAIRIGQSRDGGAWAFGLYSEGAAKTLYVNASDDPFLVIEQIKDAFSG